MKLLGAAVAGIATLVLIGCVTPGADPDPEGTAETEIGEIGVLPDMTATECAVAGSPWRIDDEQFDRDYSLAMMAEDASVASSGIAGSYALAFSASGEVVISTAGYSVSTTSKAVDASGAFDHIRQIADPGEARAEWSEADDSRALVVFIDWVDGITVSGPAHDDGRAYAGVLPAWQLQGLTGALLECDVDGAGLWVRATTPGYLDLHFVR